VNEWVHLLLLFVLVLDCDFSFAGSFGSLQQTNRQLFYSDKKSTLQKNAAYPQKTRIKTT
jgi:hypothetical protein